MSETLPGGIVTALGHVRSATEEYGHDHDQTELAVRDANKLLKLPDGQWYCYDVGVAEEEGIQLMQHSDPRPQEVLVRGGQVALAKQITTEPYSKDIEPAARLHLLKPNPGDSKRTPILARPTGLSIALFMRTLPDRITIVDEEEARQIVNHDPGPDFLLHPTDLINSLVRTLAANPKD